MAVYSLQARVRQCRYLFSPCRILLSPLPERERFFLVPIGEEQQNEHRRSGHNILPSVANQRSLIRQLDRVVGRALPKYDIEPVSNCRVRTN